jgi:hypothetical protein
VTYAFFASNPLRKRDGKMRRPFASREYSKLPWKGSTHLLT